MLHLVICGLYYCLDLFLFLGLAVVVHELDGEDDGRADRGDDVGDDQRPVLEYYALNDKEYGPQPEHAEGGHRYPVGIAGADGGDRLRQVSQYHAQRG